MVCVWWQTFKKHGFVVVAVDRVSTCNTVVAALTCSLRNLPWSSRCFTLVDVRYRSTFHSTTDLLIPQSVTEFLVDFLSLFPSVSASFSVLKVLGQAQRFGWTVVRTHLLIYTTSTAGAGARAATWWTQDIPSTHHDNSSDPEFFLYLVRLAFVAYRSRDHYVNTSVPQRGNLRPRGCEDDSHGSPTSWGRREGGRRRVDRYLGPHAGGHRSWDTWSTQGAWTCGSGGVLCREANAVLRPEEVLLVGRGGLDFQRQCWQLGVWSHRWEVWVCQCEEVSHRRLWQPSTPDAKQGDHTLLFNTNESCIVPISVAVSTRWSTGGWMLLLFWRSISDLLQFHLRNVQPWTLKSKWMAYATGNEQPLWTMYKTGVLKLFRPSIDVFLGSNAERKVPDYHIQGNLFGRRGSISHGTETVAEVCIRLIPHPSKPSTFKSTHHHPVYIPHQFLLQIAR